MKIGVMLGVVGSVFTAVSALAHEFWIKPATFSPRPGEAIGVRLFVGDGFPGESLQRNGPKIVKFAALGPSGEATIDGENGSDPAGMVTLTDPGTHILAFRNSPSRVELDAAKFEDYLKTDGLEHVIKARAEKGWSAMPGRELFSRCAKALVRVGDSSSGFDREVGMRYELIPQNDPAAIVPGAGGQDTLSVRAVFEGKPLVNAMVGLRTPDDAQFLTTARTDDTGHVTMTIPHAGMWMISSVWMTEAPAGSNAEWESTWASLTFEVPRAGVSQPVTSADRAAGPCLNGAPGLGE